MTVEKALQELNEFVGLLKKVESDKNSSPKNLPRAKELFPKYIAIMGRKAGNGAWYDIQNKNKKGLRKLVSSLFKNKKALRELVESFSSDEELSRTLEKLKNDYENPEERHAAYQKAFCANLEESNYFDKNPDAATGAKMYVLWLLYSNKKAPKKNDPLTQLITYGEQMIKVFQEIVEIQKQYSTTPILTRVKKSISSGIQTILAPFQTMYKWAKSCVGVPENVVASTAEHEEEEKNALTHSDAAWQMGKTSVIVGDNEFTEADLVLGGMQTSKSNESKGKIKPAAPSKPKPKANLGAGSLSY